MYEVNYSHQEKKNEFAPVGKMNHRAMPLNSLSIPASPTSDAQTLDILNTPSFITIDEKNKTLKIDGDLVILGETITVSTRLHVKEELQNVNIETEELVNKLNQALQEIDNLKNEVQGLQYEISELQN